MMISTISPSHPSARAKFNMASFQTLDGLGSLLSRPETSHIDLSLVENFLIRDELAMICKTIINNKLYLQQLASQNCPGADATLREGFAKFLNNYFNPSTPILAHHIVTGPGAASCLDALLTSICGRGDDGLEYSLRFSSSIQPVLVRGQDPLVGSPEVSTADFVASLGDAMDNALCEIRALILANPHKQSGQCYPQEFLEGCLKFCQQRNIHFISDETYALTTYRCAEISAPIPFTSSLSLHTRALACDISRIHTVWSVDKDFGAGGFHVGCMVSQGNQDLHRKLSLASNTPVSSLSATFATALLMSPTLPFLITLNSARLAEAYIIITSFFIRHGINYIPTSTGLTIYAQLDPSAQTLEDDKSTLETLKDAGVLVSPALEFRDTNDGCEGWVRLSFAMEKHLLTEALRRIEVALSLG
ncbi:hypothetical protein AJ80_01095 [Polytolypa hystricis UAMH7299]|uniref:Aminotransferase class I/classII large domain-containing protein n=1 Tax=Polytolypa hystricis (strain UAMH7299) TaxID=1447883 RepID=A0A2B7Z1M1_POLH7|nr:hypothetical protein AJ80_01095 [Polytolypa hystricis UAMH7299]